MSAFVLGALAPLASAQNGTGTCVEGLSIFVDHDRAIVMLSWSATPGAAFYDIHRVLDGGPNEHIGTVPAPGTMFTENPAPEGVLEYRVAADGHPSDDCPSVQVHIGGGQTPPDVPVCVGGIMAEARADGNHLDWIAIPGANSYDVLRGVGEDGPLVPHAFVVFTNTEFTDTMVEPGVLYRYSVVANGLPPPGVTCEVVRLTAIPYFAGILGAILAGVALVGGYRIARRQ